MLNNRRTTIESKALIFSRNKYTISDSRSGEVLSMRAVAEKPSRHRLIFSRTDLLRAIPLTLQKKSLRIDAIANKAFKLLNTRHSTTTQLYTF